MKLPTHSSLHHPINPFVQLCSQCPWEHTVHFDQLLYLKKRTPNGTRYQCHIQRCLTQCCSFILSKETGTFPGPQAFRMAQERETGHKGREGFPAGHFCNWFTPPSNESHRDVTMALGLCLKLAPCSVREALPESSQKCLWESEHRAVKPKVSPHETVSAAPPPHY